MPISLQARMCIGCLIVYIAEGAFSLRASTRVNASEIEQDATVSACPMS